MKIDKEDNLTLLLTAVKGIQEKWDKIAAITGENFNVFQVLRLTTKEKKTHSAFLAELLSPQGSHGQGDVFLKLFAAQLQIPFTTQFAVVGAEKYIGPIDKEYTCGGSVDIIIKSNYEALVIENKIHAEDQRKQLVRYANYLKGLKSNAKHLYYLTLDGSEPSEKSKGNLKSGTDYKCISYKVDILNWLEQCKKETSTIPLVRETIVQYINLIKTLTHQSTNQNMSKEIVDEILRTGSIQSAIEIAENITQLKSRIMEVFLKHLEKIASQKGKKLSCRGNKLLGLKETGFLFTEEGCPYEVQFYFEKDYEDIIYGITDKDDKWVKDTTGRECDDFTIWDNLSWADVYEGNERLMNDISDKVDYLFEEIRKLTSKDERKS